VALGGGVVGDLCGLAASLYKRGIAFVQCPTTLLAQVDASVGGKTAVNLPSGKNLAGTFHQPVAVLADVATLATLPESEFESGLGEVLKTALLAGEDALGDLERDVHKLRERDPLTLERTVEACVAFKARIVAQDPREGGLRKCLNLGHTFAHGIEHSAGFGRIPHGVAVAAGIGLAFDHAAASGVLLDVALCERVHALARDLHLPSSLEEIEDRYGLHVSEVELLASMRTDKKNKGSEIRLVLPVRAGEVRIDVPFSA
jgi:3-dehydroquinate synthase